MWRAFVFTPRPAVHGVFGHVFWPSAARSAHTFPVCVSFSKLGWASKELRGSVSRTGTPEPKDARETQTQIHRQTQNMKHGLSCNTCARHAQSRASFRMLPTVA